jgi:hypothetical protein
METDFFNPARKYRNFRPRQAMRGRAVTGTPTNLATVCLYNNSSGPFVLAIRDITISGPATDTINLSYQKGQVASTAGLQTSLVSNEAIQNGQMFSVDTATVYPADYSAALTAQGAFWWQHDFPFGVVIPQYSLVFQDSTAAHAFTVSLIWEAIQVDQLDYFF